MPPKIEDVREYNGRMLTDLWNLTDAIVGAATPEKRAKVIPWPAEAPEATTASAIRTPVGDAPDPCPECGSTLGCGCCAKEAEYDW